MIAQEVYLHHGGHDAIESSGCRVNAGRDLFSEIMVSSDILFGIQISIQNVLLNIVHLTRISLKKRAHQTRNMNTAPFSPSAAAGKMLKGKQGATGWPHLRPIRLRTALWQAPQQQVPQAFPWQEALSYVWISVAQKVGPVEEAVLRHFAQDGSPACQQHFFGLWVFWRVEVGLSLRHPPAH